MYNIDMNRRFIRSILAVMVLILTLCSAGYFLRHNPAVLKQLSATPLSVLILLLSMYLLFMAILWWIFRASLQLCRAVLPQKETLVVTAYSSIINFFGPLQSGPIFRAVYLKKRHNVSLGKYAAASLVYYVFYAVFSGLFLLNGLLGWWTILCGFALLGVCYGVLQLPYKRIRDVRRLNQRGLGLMAAATFSQVALLGAIFYIELHSIDSSINVSQAITYTGAANFALFVSITPGAIGFREAFVFLAQHLHHISVTTVAAASLLDRGVYITMLLILVIILFTTHARENIRRLGR